jgi:excisionase family DNA binding protein
MSAASPDIVAAQPAQTFEPFVDPDTAAAFLGITRRTLLQKVRSGKIPGHALDRGAKKKEWRFKLSELDLYLCSAINSVLQPPEPANRRN